MIVDCVVYYGAGPVRRAFRLDVPVRSDYALPTPDPSSRPPPGIANDVNGVSADYPDDHPESSGSTVAPQSHSTVMTGTPLYTHTPSAWGPSYPSDQSLYGSSHLSQPLDLDQHQRASRGEATQFPAFLGAVRSLNLATDRFSVDVQQRDSVQHGWIQNIASATTHDSGYDAPQSVGHTIIAKPLWNVLIVFLTILLPGVHTVSTFLRVGVPGTAP